MTVEPVELQAQTLPREGRGEGAAAACLRRGLALRFGVLLALAASAAAETGFSFAAGTDTSGRAQAVSNAAGRVMIESPEFPRGLWVELTDEAGEGLAGLQVEYHGRRDSLVALRCVDPSGLRQETLLLSRPGGDLVEMKLKPVEPVELPEGAALVGLRIDPSAEALLEFEEVPPLSGPEALVPYLRERWQGRTGRVAVRIDSTAAAIDAAQPELVAPLVELLQDRARGALGETRASAVQQEALLNARLLKSGLEVLDGVVLVSISFVLVEGSELEKWVLRASEGSKAPVTLAKADSIEWLHLSHLKLVDVSPLAALKNLKTLYLNSNTLVDVSPLSALTNLEFLYLEHNEVVDASPLAALTNLKELYLGYNEIVDVSSLSVLNNLEVLEMQYNDIVDVDALGALTNLKRLSLDFNQVVDVSPLSTLSNLEVLWLIGNQVVDASPLSALSNLELLWLMGNRVADVSPLSDLSNLVGLFLSGNPISDVGPLSGLTNLHALGLQKTGIVDLSPFAGLTNLGWLSLADNQISDAGPLSGLSNLYSLGLSENRIVDLGPLAALTELIWLHVENNQVADVGPLAGLTELDELLLSDNDIEEIGPLVANPGLGRGDTLNLYGNPLSDTAVNEQIPALQKRGVEVTW